MIIPMIDRFEIQVEALDAPEVVDLLSEHLENVRSVSPPEATHALNAAGLADPAVTFYGVRYDGELVGCGALKQLDAEHGELKSMRTARVWLRKGVASSLMHHMLAEASRRGYQRISLETGASEDFAPARRLYERFGFATCDRFGEYPENPFSVFMTREL